MSVKVNTPSETSFGETGPVTDFCAKLDNIVSLAVGKQKITPDPLPVSKEKNLSTKSTPFAKKRRPNEKGLHALQGKKKGSWFEKQNQKEIIKLPTKFLLGGNINDPLNLNSFNNEEINKAVNAVTPVSSPLPTPSHRRQKVEVLIPPNITDPLNLNSGEDVDLGLVSPRSSAKKRKKHRRKKSCEQNVDKNQKSDQETPTQIKAALPTTLTVQVDKKPRKISDCIVSPAIPQDSPKPKRKRTMSETKSSDCKINESPVKSAEKQKNKKQFVNKPIPKPVFRSKDDKFIFGNYDRYYGKRNPETEEDKRLNCFQKEWFYGKDVLDIGCNIGHISLSIAKNFEPKNVTGMDIDPKLISIARKNIRHYISNDRVVAGKFPMSLPSTLGPVAAPPVPDLVKPTFPSNIHFVQGNYVLDSDELLELQTEEFDVILGLSLTKWIHLNFGDEGLKRAFKRMYKQLRPGGKLILEPQSRSTYKKKKKLNEKIWKNYQGIHLWPEKFRTYLLSAEVGFLKCDYLETPYNKSKGFQRPIMVFTKAETTTTTPLEITESRGVTPLMNIDCGSHNLTPHLEGSYYTPTQTYDLHPSFSFSSAHLPIRGYDAFLESPTSRALTPTQELFAVTGRIGTPRFDVGTPSASARNTPSRQINCFEGEGPSWVSSENVVGEQLFDQLSDQEGSTSEAEKLQKPVEESHVSEARNCPLEISDSSPTSDFLQETPREIIALQENFTSNVLSNPVRDQSVQDSMQAENLEAPEPSYVENQSCIVNTNPCEQKGLDKTVGNDKQVERQ